MLLALHLFAHVDDAVDGSIQGLLEGETLVAKRVEEEEEILENLNFVLLKLAKTSEDRSE